MSNLSTCGRCGGVIERRPGAACGWGHVTETARNADGHLPDPDDSHVSGPDRSDLPLCSGCGHPEHTEDEGLCEERIGTDLYGTDGVEVTRWCPCPGLSPARLRLHTDPRCPELYAVTPGRDACTCPRPRPDEVSPDPWTDPDAAARAVPPPF